MKIIMDFKLEEKSLKRKILIAVSIIALIVAGYFIYDKVFKSKATNTTTTAQEERDEDVKRTEEEYNDEVIIKTNIPIDEVWEFSFSNDIDEKTITSQNIKVLNEEKEEVPTSISLSENGNTIIINPPEGGYQKGGTYELNITDDVLYTNGNPVRNSYRMDFITVRDEVEKGVYNKELVHIEQEQVKSFEGNTLTLSKDVKSDLVVGDILVIPSTENPEGQALKIETVDRKLTSNVVTVRQPDFAELFEDLDIYKTYEITSEHIQLEEGIEGIEVEDFALVPTNTMIASSKNKSNEGVEYQIPSVKMDITNGFKFKLDKFQVGKGKKKVFLSGDIKFKKPKVESDVKLGLSGIKRFNIVSKTGTEHNFKVSLPAVKDGIDPIVIYEDKTKKKLKKMSEKVKLAKVNVPTSVPGVFIQGELNINLTHNFSYTPEVTVSFDFDDERGVIYDGKKIKPVKNTNHDLDVKIEGSGKVETKLGSSTKIGISALKVLGAGVEGFGGAKGTGEFFNGVGEKFNNYACYKLGYSTVVEGSLYVDILKDTVTEMKFAEMTIPPKYSDDNCVIFKDLSLDSDPINLKMGESKTLKVKGNYINISNEKVTSGALKELDNLKVSSSDKDVVTAKIKNGKITVKAGDNPPSDKATITVTYSEKYDLFNEPIKSKVEIPVNITNIPEFNPDGKWTRNIFHNTGHLNITNSASDSFDFSLEAYNGTHVGAVEGTATLDGKKAVWEESEFGCRIDFSLSNDKIEIEQTDECQNWVGAGAAFYGTYEKGDVNINTNLVKQGILTSSEDSLFKSVVGEGYELFLNAIGSYSEGTDKDGLGTRVVEGFVRGIAAQMAGIIMINSEYVYAAVIDDGTLRYYTNDPNYASLTPDTIQSWSEGLDFNSIDYIYTGKEQPINEDTETNGGNSNESSDKKITTTEAEQLVREVLGLGDSPYNFVYDHDDENGNYVIHVYELIDKGTEREHNATYGWFAVEPSTGNVLDVIFD